MHGDYDRVDSILRDYDSNSLNRKESASRYRHLLQMGRRFVDDGLTSTDFSLVDSLCHYYEEFGSRDKYGKALCFAGEIYKVSGDYPSALNEYLKATRVAEECGDSYLSGWLFRVIGDLYFDQRMLNECTDYYKKYFNIAVANSDTLRMAMASFSMGKVYMTYSNMDSIIYYFEKAIELGRQTKRPENIVPFARCILADIYIQVEEYEKARDYMSYDSLNASNWAYWHLGQNHTDSAICYFQMAKDFYSLIWQSEARRRLAQLEESRGNAQKALSYYKQLLSVEDSLKSQSQIAETRKVNAQYNLNLIKQERKEIAERANLMSVVIYILLAIVVFGTILGYYVWRYYQQKREKELSREKLLRQIEEEKNSQSISQIKENKRIIAELEKQLADARQRDDVAAARKLELDTEQLKAKNLNIEANQRRHQFLLEEFQKSSLYINIKKHAGEVDFHLTEEEWEALAEEIDRIYNNFTQRLFMLVQLSDVELKTCYLIKLKTPPADIAVILYKSKAAISMLRQRLYEKITQKKGTAKQLDEFILNF